MTTVPATSLQGTSVLTAAAAGGMGKFFVQRSSPLVIAVVCTRMRCSLVNGFAVGTGCSTVMITAVDSMSGWTIAFWVLGTAIAALEAKL